MGGRAHVRGVAADGKTKDVLREVDEIADDACVEDARVERVAIAKLQGLVSLMFR